VTDEELDEKIRNYFESQIPEPDMEALARIKSKFQEQPVPSRRFNFNLFWKSFVAAICFIAVILPCILIPVLSKSDSNNDRYYTENDVQRVELQKDFMETYINQNYPQYNFIFEDCDFNGGFGYYAENNRLMALSLEMIRKVIYIDVTINIIVDNHYYFSADSTYKNQATITNREGHKLYYKEVENFYETTIYGLFEFKDYSLYLMLSDSDNTFFNKF